MWSLTTPLKFLWDVFQKVLPFNEKFPNVVLLQVDINPYHAHIANYLITRELPKE